MAGMVPTQPVVRDVLAEADPIIYGDPEIKSHKEITVGTCIVVARTVMLPLVPIGEDGKSVAEPMYPPALTLKLTILEPKEDLQMVHAILGAERIRDYLAYSTGVRIPIRWVMASRRFLFPQQFLFSGESYMPAELLIGRTPYADWAREIERGMLRAQRLLDTAEPDSPLDRAVDLIGRAITTEDRESCFLYSWRAIETISAMDLEVARDAAKRGDLRAGDSYVGPQLTDFLKGEEEIQLSIGLRCAVTLAGRVPGFDAQKGRKWYRLRGRVAHAGLSAEDYRDVLQAVPEVLGLARTCVASKLKESDALAPPQS